MDLHRSHPVPRPHIQPHAEGWLPAAKLLPQVRGTVSIHVCVCVCVFQLQHYIMYVCMYMYVPVSVTWCVFWGTCETLSVSSIYSPMRSTAVEYFLQYQKESLPLAYFTAKRRPPKCSSLSKGAPSLHLLHVFLSHLCVCASTVHN